MPQQPSKNELLNGEVMAACLLHGMVAERLGRSAGYNWTVFRNDRTVGQLRYNQMYRNFRATSPRMRTTALWGSLEQAVIDLAEVVLPGEVLSKKPGVTAIKLVLEFDEPALQAIGRALGLEGLPDRREIETWVKHEIHASVEDVTKLLLEVNHEQDRSDGNVRDHGG